MISWNTSTMNNNFDSVYLCYSGEFISTAYVSDGEEDCRESNYDNKTSDEVGFITSHADQCSHFFYRDVRGTCRSFLHQKISQKKRTNYSIFVSQIKCKNGEIISKELVNDLVSDCPEEDEIISKQIVQVNANLECTNPNLLPCIPGHSRCYHFYDICIFRLNKNNKLIPCRTGSHIQECEQFECNSHFKCPRYYCIPWGYICDGKWDCPNGYDEIGKNRCYNNTNRKCKTMFRCKNSQLCLHVADFCDGYDDCPYNDDEILCNLKYPNCL